MSVRAGYLLLRCGALLATALPLRSDGQASAGGDARGEAKAEAALERAVAKADQVAGQDGFSKRSAVWRDVLSRESKRSVSLQLYEGNEYWLVLGHDLGTEIDVAVYDSRGRLVPVATRRSEGSTLLQLKAPRSGAYEVELRAPGGESGAPVAFALTYVYK